MGARSWVYVAVAATGVVASFGALGLIAPQTLLDVVRGLTTPMGLYVAVGIRLVLGLALILAAPASRAPRAVRTVGVVILAAGLITPFMGAERFSNLLEWWSGAGLGFVRAAAAINVAVGALLISVLLPRARAD